jgi:hypothetical protein
MQISAHQFEQELPKGAGENLVTIRDYHPRKAVKLIHVVYKEVRY